MVPTSLIATPGMAEVTVNANRLTSLAYAFTIVGEPTTITSLSPNPVTAGGPAFTLTVNGTGFASGDVVNWNGSALSTTYVSATQLTASVPASLIVVSATAAITVVSGGVTTSNSYPLAVIPSITSVGRQP